MKLTSLLVISALVAALPNTRAATTSPIELVGQEDVIHAALTGQKEIIQNAIKQGFDINRADSEKRTPLMFAAYNAQSEIAALLIKGGAKLNAQDTIGTTPLMFAASAPGGKATLQVLLDAGAKIDQVDTNEHFSALMWAAAEGQIDNVKFLLTQGANLSLKDIDGDTAESFATKAKHLAVAKLLKETAAKQAALKTK